MSDPSRSGVSEGASTPGSPWPAPHPVLDAPYGPRFGGPHRHPPVVTPPAPAQGEPARRTRVLLTLTAVCVAIALAGGVLAYRFVMDQRFPNAWDPRVAPMAAFVERATGQTFDHPIYVRFLADAEFNELITDSPESLTESERDALEQQEALGRAFGWYDGTTDVQEEQNKVYGAGVLALYNFASQQVIVRSKDPNPQTLPVQLRVTIAHELVHALQDQRLDIRDLQSTVDTSEAQAAFTALVEGHAVNIETAYLYGLPESEQDAYFDFTEQVMGDVDEATADTAPVLSVNLEAPYVVGPALVRAAQVSSGGIEQLYLKPPIAQDQVLDPRAYFADDRPEATTEPEVAGEVLDRGSVGIVRLYLTLASVLDPAEAWSAALGWGNDTYVLHRPTPEGPACVSWNIYADDANGAAALRRALTAWAEDRPTQSSVRVGATNDPINITMCDPGVSVRQELVAESAIDYFYVRASLLDALIGRSGDLKTAWCATDELMRTESVPDLQEPDDAVLERVSAAIAAC